MKTELSKRGGANLRYVRKRRGMTTDDLCDLMMQKFGEEISPSAILKYECGDRPISQVLTAQFAACLNCSIATLMDGMDMSQEPKPDVQELRKPPPVVHDIFYWCAPRWNGNIVALATAWGLYAATPGRYRKYAMMELLNQSERAVSDGAMKYEDIPPP